VDDLRATLDRLTRAASSLDRPRGPAGHDGPRTAFLADPDGHVIELFQWPLDHPDGITEADFSDGD
jgi:lactoylglutathione lyase